MQPTRAVGMVTNWPWRRRLGRTQALPRNRAARRIETYVYGNVLVLAVIVALGTAEVTDGRAALLVLGTAASTFLAHLLATIVGHQAYEQSETSGREIAEAARDGVPMATSGLLPAVALALGWLGWLDSDWAWWLAMSIVGARFVLLGSVVSYLKGEPSTWRNLLIGIAVAVAGLLVALVKSALTH